MMKNLSFKIRKARKGDAESWIDFWNEGIKRKFFIYTEGNKIRTKEKIEKLEKRYSSQTKRNFILFAIDNKTKKIIGYCSCSGKEKGRTRHRADLGWMIHPDHTKKGVATALLKEAIKLAKNSGIERFEAEVATKNIASIKLAKNLGFHLEGKKEKALLLDNGKYTDTYLFGLC